MKKAIVSIVSLLLCVLLLLSVVLPAFAASDDDDDFVKVRSVLMSTPFTTVRINQTKSLFADVYPRNASDHEIAWSSSNTEIAIVDDYGIVTGISPGTTTIWARADNKFDKCEVTVPGSVLDIKENADNRQLSRGKNSGELLSAVDIRYDAGMAVRYAKPNDRANRQPVIYSSKTRVTTTALRSAAFAAKAAGGTVDIKVRTLNGDGTIQGQISIKPETAPNTDSEIKLGVYTAEENLGTYPTSARRSFGKEVALIYLAHSGDYPLPVAVAAKIDLSGFNIDNLAIYYYNTTEKKYSLMPDQSYRVDSAGFIHINPKQGGIVVITEAV